MAKNRPSRGRSQEDRGLDQFDTPPIALAPLFTHEPLLAGVTAVCEPFCGKGNLVIAMRERGLTVHASDIEYRGCPDSTVLDFLKMTTRPCDMLVNNPPFRHAMRLLEHAIDVLQFPLVVLLLKIGFISSEERFERLHPRGILRRVYSIAERVQGMHDAKHIAKGGKLASQSDVHGWHVFDRNYYGPPVTIPVSIDKPDIRMPWAGVPAVPVRAALCTRCGRSYPARRITSRFCSDACRQYVHRHPGSVT